MGPINKFKEKISKMIKTPKYNHFKASILVILIIKKIRKIKIIEQIINPNNFLIFKSCF